MIEAIENTETDHKESVVVTKDNDGTPYCSTHHCRMKTASGGKKGSPVRYVQCPVPGCETKEKMVKTVNPGVVPATPLQCPRCERSNRQVFCEHDASHSTAASVILKCPRCQWRSTALVVPHLAAMQLAARQRGRHSVADLGDR